MARTTKQKQWLLLDCKACIRSFDPHSPALDGHMILVRCELDAHRSHFMERDGCRNFQKKRLI